MINITKGTDHVLLLTLTRGSAPLPLSESSEVVVKARNTYGAQTVLNRRFSTDHEGAMEADWPYTLPVGAYTLEVTGLLEGEGRWRASGQLVQVTTDTDHGTESETIRADTYDVVISVSVRPGREGVDEELRQKIADMIDEEYNASEAVREAAAAADHTRAESDHDYAAADHTRAESDHAAAAADHTQASTDHAASTEATTKASNVNVSINGTVVTITDKNGVQTSIDIGFDIHKTYASVSAMNADAANVADGKFVMIATTDATSVENARLYVRNSNAASSAEPFTFICDLDQAASSAWADWFNNYKPTIESDHTRAESDHTQASTDHDTAAADHTQASTDHDTAAADHTQAGTDHAASIGATGAANAAASLANTAAQAADTAREQLMAKEVTMDDFDEILQPPTGVDPDYEVVKVVLTDDIGGLNLQGLPVAIYLNGSETASETKTADANGCIVFTLPVGTHYRLAFTQVAGSEEIPDEEHTALLIWRAVERTYKEPEAGEEVTVTLRREGSAYEPIADAVVTVVYGNRAITKQTDAQGSVKFSVPIGAVYEVVAPEVTGLYARQNRYAQRFTASETRRNVYFTYSEYEVGVFILATDGAQFDLIGWQEAVAQGTRQNSEAVAIKVSTASLVQNGGVFALDIDMLASGTRMPANKAWSPNTSYTFTSVPANGNSSAAAYYYDGYTASRNIQQEGDEKNISTPAVDACLGLTLAVGEETLPGFLGSVGQWTAAWNNASVIDQIIAAVRPESTGRLSSRTGNKWTCAQNNAGIAWSWSSSASSYNKTNSIAVVPFFAY